MLKLAIHFIFVLSSTAYANTAISRSCQTFLAPQHHLVAKHYHNNLSYRAALKRFKIQDFFGKSHRNMNPSEQVSNYFKHIDSLYTFALKDSTALEKLRTQWLNRALIREVPQSYIEHQRNVARQNGQQADFDRTFNRDGALRILQKQQKDSFLSWFDYIMGADIDAPSWLRYILLEELLEVGNFNPRKETFSQRTNETVGPYPQLNSEAFGHVYTSLSDYYRGDYKSISPEVLKTISKNERRAFANIYAHKLTELNKIENSFDLEVTEGQWFKFEQGNERHAKELFESLQGKNTNWCTASTCGTTSGQIKEGDFYVYYSKDFNNEYTVPRLAIRRKQNQIAEVRGRANDQNLDSEIAKTNILEDKLSEFGAEGERYKIRAKHMKRLTEIDKKNNKNEELSRNDLMFLYEIDDTIQGFGYGKDPRIKEIISTRDVKKDLAYTLSIRSDQISLTQDEAISGGIVYHYGDLFLHSLTSAEGLNLPEHVGGNLYFNSLTSAKGLVFPKSIHGSLNLSSLTSAEGLRLPESVGGYLNLRSLTSAEGLKLPKSVGGVLDLFSLISTEGLKLPKNLDGQYIGPAFK